MVGSLLYKLLPHQRLADHERSFSANIKIEPFLPVFTPHRHIPTTNRENAIDMVRLLTFLRKNFWKTCKIKLGVLNFCTSAACLKNGLLELWQPVILNQSLCSVHPNDEGKSDKGKIWFLRINTINEIKFSPVKLTLVLRGNADYCLAAGRMEVRSIREIQPGEEVISNKQTNKQQTMIMIFQITICYANFLEKDGPVTRKERKSYLSWAYRSWRLICWFCWLNHHFCNDSIINQGFKAITQSVP